jgi:cyclase
MLNVRVIPTLLLRNNGLVKGCRFKDQKYVGDPINAVKIFNEKEVDELVFFDIVSTSSGKGPNYELLRDIASEAFMPFGYGGGITNCQQIEKLFNLGVEKVILNSAAHTTPQLIKDASMLAGSQSIVVSIDAKKTLFGGYEVYVSSGQQRTKKDPVEFAKRVQDLGAGEIIICSIDQEGTGQGYDKKLLKAVCSAVGIPVVASGGAGKLDDFSEAVNSCGASAVAAGDMFVFHGKHKAVLITYPKHSELSDLFKRP